MKVIPKSIHHLLDDSKGGIKKSYLEENYYDKDYIDDNFVSEADVSNFVTIQGPLQTVLGEKKLKNISLLNIPGTAPSSSDIDAGKSYLYSSYGSYAEVPGGGGGGGGETLTILRNGTQVATYNGSTPVSANILVPTTVASLSDASDYATKTWVENKGYITSAALSGYVTIATDQEITGAKYFSNALAIPLSAPSSPTSGLSYLYAGSGSYAEEPGGGVADVYPLTITKNGSSWLYYDPGEEAVSVNLSVPTKVSDLTNDSGFITSSALNGYATQTWVEGKGYITSSALNGYVNDFEVTGNGNAVTTGSKSGSKITLTKGNTFVDLTSAQTITGAKKHANVALLNIPTSISSSDIESGKVYLYSGSGEYAEEASGGVADVYPLYLVIGGTTTTYDPASESTTVTFGSAAKKGYTTNITQGSADLPTSGAVYSAIAAAVTSALHYRGMSSTALTDGGTETAVIGGVALVPQSGDVVIYGGFEFLWENSVWNKLGDDSSYALKTIQISAGTGLSGGGDLTSSRTISLSSATIASLGLADSALQSSDMKALTLKVGTTTIGSDYNALAVKTYTISKTNITDTIGSTTYAPYHADGYLPLSAGSTKPLTNDLYFTKTIYGADVQVGCIGSVIDGGIVTYFTNPSSGSGSGTGPGFAIINTPYERLLFWLGSTDDSWEIYHEGNLTKGVLTTLLESNNGYYVKKAGDTMTGTLNSQSIIPTSNTSYDLGFEASKWNNIYTRAIYATIAKIDGLLAIPTEAPQSGFIVSGEAYLYSSTGSYAETPGGGVADVYPLTITKNGSAWLSYNPGVQAESINLSIPTKVSDLTNDAGYITAASIPSTYAWSAITGTPTTLSGYGITDAKIETPSGTTNRKITLGSNNFTIYSWALASTKPSYTLDEVTDGSTRKLANYLPLTGGTLTGPLIVASTTAGNFNEGIRLTRASNSWVGITFGSTGNQGLPGDGWFAATNPNKQFIIAAGDSASTSGLCLNKAGDAKWRDNVIYHAGNLSLATLAGSSAIGSTSKPVYYNGSSLVACSSSLTDYLPLAGGVVTGNVFLKGSANLVTNSTGNYANGIRINRASTSTRAGMTIGYVSSDQAGGGTGYDSHTWMIATPATSDYLNISYNGNTSTTIGLTLKGNGVNDLLWNNNKVWHEGNDGSGSGLDADLLDGKHASDILTGIEALKVTTESDATFTYRAVPSVAVGDVARVTKVKGKTIVWNQLVPTNWFATNTPANVSWTNNGDGSYTINGTASATGQVVAFSPRKSWGDHKYYLATSDSSIAIYFNGTNANQGTYTDSRQIVTAQASDTYYPVIRFQSGASFSNKKVYIKIIDLTLMFGKGSEPASVAEFEALYPLPYYAYNPGELISNKTESIETGFNLLDENTMFLNVPGIVRKENGWYGSSAQFVNGGHYWDNKMGLTGQMYIYMKAQQSASGGNFRFTIAYTDGTSESGPYMFGTSIDSYVISSAVKTVSYIRADYGSNRNVLIQKICLARYDATSKCMEEPYETDSLHLNTSKMVNAKLPKLKLNQLVKNFVAYNSASITTSGTNITVSNTNSNAVMQIVTGNSLPMVKGHKYIFYNYVAQIVPATISSIQTVVYNGSVQQRPYTNLVFTYTGATDTCTVIWQFTRTDTSNPTSFTIPIPNIYDLTAMYGAGLEPTSVAEVEELVGNYHPYTTGEDMPNYIFPKGLKGAGTAYDEALGKRAIKRIGVMDLGTLNWSMINNASYPNRFTVTISAMANNGNNIIPNYANKGVGGYGSQIAEDKSYDTASGTALQIHDSAYTDAATFQAAMAGVKLYYELATPVEYETESTLPELVDNDTLGTQKQIPSVKTTSGGIEVFPEGPQIVYGSTDVHDEVHDNIAIKRIGIIDLGDLTYSNYTYTAGSSTYPWGYVPLNISDRHSGNNIRAIGYETVSGFSVCDYSINPHASNASAYLINSSFIGMTGAQIKAALKGVKCYYELATPVTYTLDENSISAPFRCDFQYGANPGEIVSDSSYRYLPLAGGTVTGTLECKGELVVPDHAPYEPEPNKHYLYVNDNGNYYQS